MSFQDIRNADRRLALLRLLEAEPDRAMNDSLLHKALEYLGHGTSRDVVRSDIAWLAELGLVHQERIIEAVLVATLTQRGEDVAKGRAVVPGIARPSPTH